MKPNPYIQFMYEKMYRMSTGTPPNNKILKRMTETEVAKKGIKEYNINY